jgi:hypothetical protein
MITYTVIKNHFLVVSPPEKTDHAEHHPATSTPVQEAVSAKVAHNKEGKAWSK